MLTVSLEGDISQFHKRHRAVRRIGGCRRGEFHGPIMFANTEVETEIFIVNKPLETPDTRGYSRNSWDHIFYHD